MSDNNTKPVIIIVAPNGAKKTKEVHPNIPLKADEIAKEAMNCLDAGASIIHLHVRDEDHIHTLDLNTYKKAISATREKIADRMIIQATTESVGMYSPEEQFDMVYKLKPESASFALREIIPDPSYEKEAARFLAFVKKENIFPQYILYSPEEIIRFAELKEKGVIPAGKDFLLFVLGKKNAPDNQTESYAKPQDLYPFIKTKDKYWEKYDIEWAICAFGGYENECMKEAVKHGGHVRIGFENNHLLSNGEIAPDNASLIRQFVNSLNDFSNRKTANLKDVSALFSMNNNSKIAC